MTYIAPVIGNPKSKNWLDTKKVLFVGFFCFWSVLFSAHIYSQQLTMSFNRLLHFGTDVPAAFKPANVDTNINGDISGQASGLQVLSLGYRSYDAGAMSDSQIAVVVSQAAAADAAIPAEVIGSALFYPNPARQSDDARLGYQLSKNMDIELQMYDMMANRIFKGTFPAGTNGGKSGYNKLKLNLDTFSGYSLSAGVYFYLIIHDGKVLAKGKVAVIP
jgi:hypothetical protein